MATPDPVTPERIQEIREYVAGTEDLGDGNWYMLSDLEHALDASDHLADDWKEQARKERVRAETAEANYKADQIAHGAAVRNYEANADKAAARVQELEARQYLVPLIESDILLEIKVHTVGGRMTAQAASLLAKRIVSRYGNREEPA